jgi:hypothetical protein
MAVTDDWGMVPQQENPKKFAVVSKDSEYKVDDASEHFRMSCQYLMPGDHVEYEGEWYVVIWPDENPIRITKSKPPRLMFVSQGRLDA